MAIREHVKPTILSFSIFLAAIFTVRAQTNSSSVSSAETPASTVQTNVVHPLGPPQIIEARLKKIEIEAPVTYRTNGNLVFCTVACRDLEQRNAIYDGFSNLAKYGLTATKNPPSVTVVLLSDATKYLNEQQNQKLVAKLQGAATNLIGHVLQKISDGLLVSLTDSEIVLVTEAPNLGDGDAIKVAAFRVGNYEITDKNGVRRVLRKFTCDVAVATDHWTPMATSEAKAETQKRTELSQ